MKGNMVALNDEYLIFQNRRGGGSTPRPVKRVVMELLSTTRVNPKDLSNAVEIVDRHFRVDLRRQQMTVAEFSEVLQMVLSKFDYEFSDDVKDVDPRVIEADSSSCVA